MWRPGCDVRWPSAPRPSGARANVSACASRWSEGARGYCASSRRPLAAEIGLRRRLWRQRRVREALLLDLGALVYDLHREGRRAPELLRAKASRLDSVDGEVRALEQT